MASFTKLMKELDYPTNPEGVCSGLAFMAERARRCGQYDKFRERITYLNQLGENQLASLISLAKKRAASIDLNSSESLTKNEKILLTVEAFFFQVWSHFEPSDIQGFLKLGGANLSQDDAYILESYIYDVGSEDKEISPLLPPKQFFISNSIQSNQVAPIQSFLQEIQSHIEKQELSLGVIISSAGHTVHVFYDCKRQCWTLTNHSTISDSTSIEDISKKITDAFTDNNVTNLSLSIFIDENRDTQELWQKLETISNNSLKSIIQNKAVNNIDSYGETPLLVAAAHGHFGVVKNLINQQEIDVNQADFSGATPLAAAAQNGHPSIVRALLQHPEIDVNRKNNSGSTALIAAVQNNRLDVVQELLSSPNIDVNKANQNFLRPLYIAAMLGFTEIVDELMKHPKIEMDFFRYPLAIAVEKGHLEVVRTLLNYPEQINVNYGATLAVAVKEGYFAIVQELLNHPDIDVNYTDRFYNPPLVLATERGDLGVVQALLKNPQINPNLENQANCRTPLKAAILNGHIDIVKELLKFEDLEVNYVGRFSNSASALILAIRVGRNDIVIELLKHPKTDINKTDTTGRTPLDIAKELGHQDIISSLNRKYEDLEHQRLAKNEQNGAITNLQNESSLIEESNIEAKNNYLMQPIFNFIQSTIVKLKEAGKITAYDAFDQYQWDLKEDIKYFNDILDPQISLSHLANLVEHVNVIGGPNTFFAAPPLNISNDYKEAMDEMGKRYLAITAEMGQDNILGM